MGKGQRARDLRSQDKMVNPQNYAKKKKTVAKKNSWVTPLVTVLVVVLLLGVFVLTYLNDNGIVLRAKTTMETENFKISGTMMQYATMSTYQNFVSNYSSIIQYFGLDTSKPLASQQYGDGTWLDYFKNSAKTSLETTLVYAEAAKAAGVELDAEDLEEIEDSINAIKSAASYYGYSGKAYMSMLFGKGVSENDIREFHKIVTLSSKYEQQVADDYKSQVTDEDISKYYGEHMDDYSLVDVITYKDTIKLEAALTAEEKAAKKAELVAKFDAMAAATTAEEFKEALENYLMAAEAKDIESTLNTAEKTIAKSGISLTPASEWVFEVADSAYTRLDGEVKVFTSDDAKTEEKAEEKAEDTEEDTDSNSVDASELLGDSSSSATEEEFSVTVYYLVRAPYANDKETKNVGHLLVKPDDYASDDEAKAAAEKLYEDYKAGEMTKESFEALAEEHTADSSVFYDDVKSGDMVEEFDAWIFDEARKEGDTDIVKTEYGYHIMYFVGEGRPTWQADCLTAIVGDKTGDFLKELQEKYPIEVNESAIKSVRG